MLINLLKIFKKKKRNLTTLQLLMMTKMKFYQCLTITIKQIIYTKVAP